MSCQRRTRSAVHTFGVGRFAGGNSTSDATFTVSRPCFTAGLSVARSVSRIRRIDVGPTGRCHFTAAIFCGSPLLRYSAMRSLCSTIASNMLSRCGTPSLSLRM
ncbi:hypothetical protein [Amycolatopsis japonica]|uniref:hypothetical protein n=1 Tax=Amycolatopsis japonica TaxID=208439 RepID=UPI00056F1417|nr:hypothetical protein [Amycolatopsis japonica]